jgi:predicted DNA-binding protein (MmcQ/YjbR family)
MEPNHITHSVEGLEMLEQVRRICADLPESEETIDGFGHFVFRVNGKPFVRLSGTEELPSLSLKSDTENQEFLLMQGRFYKTPYIGQHGWVSIDSPTDWDELSILLREAYLFAAPKRLVKQVKLTN